MASIFTRIINGEIPSYKIAEDDRYFAFLDINPLAKGHTLVVPKKEVDKLFDLDDETYNGIFPFCKRIASSIEKSFDCNRVSMMVVGLEVPHAHIHLVPINNMGDVNFARPKLSISKDEMNQIASIIRSNLD